MICTDLSNCFQTRSPSLTSVPEPWRTGAWSPTEKPPSYIILPCHPMEIRSGWQQSSPMSSLIWYHTKIHSAAYCPPKTSHHVFYLSDNNRAQLWNVFKDLPVTRTSVLSVVWELGDHEVVERLVAQRGVCHLRLLPWSRQSWTKLEYGEFLFSGGHLL